MLNKSKNHQLKYLVASFNTFYYIQTQNTENPLKSGQIM